MVLKTYEVEFVVIIGDASMIMRGRFKDFDISRAFAKAGGYSMKKGFRLVSIREMDEREAWLKDIDP